jgi:hypothetical protein
VIALTNQQWEILLAKIEKLIENVPTRRKLDDKILARLEKLEQEIKSAKQS